MAACRWILLLAVVAAALVRTPAGAVEGSGSLAASAATLIQNFAAAGADGKSSPLPALSVAIGRDGTLLYADGFGDVDDQHRSASAQTIYMVGSITKQFTATAVLRLIEKHAVVQRDGSPLTTATPLASLLDVADGWTLEGGPPITVGNLLSMTSNLPNFTRRPPHELDPWGAVPARRLLDGIKGYRPSGFPGSFEYSNTSYFLLSELMEAVEVDGVSRDYRRILQEEVFSRLGLADTGFGNDPSFAHRLASPHYRRRPRFSQPDWLKGSGDVASSVLDIFKWNKALMEGRALTPAMRDVMLSDSARVDVWTYYGAGWFITHKDGVDRYFHSGTVSGYTAFNLIVRPRTEHWVSVTLLTNSDGVEDLDVLADKLASLVLAP
ncbi:serine hydrolase domain-containing protein [Hyphomicrobium sp.]|uniref:serine hydrolase domain-containing protein n=1 Tax=Hyphomicrobium sp. TaxID=82 RepID=UPI001D914E90|nr:serine hydrolase domain-containing protein [Hyphomicrobium sp.]MBY0559598.1 beta-lactamase family protein [Hyphomicrobium sp.]